MAPATGDDPTGYQFRSAVDDRWSDWAATSSMTGHTVTGLTNGKEYTFEVRAMNAAGNGHGGERDGNADGCRGGSGNSAGPVRRSAWRRARSS